MELYRDANNIIRKWCTHWNIPEPSFILDSDKGYGFHEIENNQFILGVNPDKTKSHMAEIVVLHELRHHYQSIKYSEFYNWWSDEIKYYEFFYKSPICVIEEDANIFSWTKGKKNGESLFDTINQNYVVSAYEDIQSRKRSIKEIESEIRKMEIEHNISDWRFSRRLTVEKSEWSHKYILLPSK